MIESAVNAEHAVNLLDRYGLRKKFAAIFDTPDVKNSLSWWMNKEPLRSFEIRKPSDNAFRSRDARKGYGKTAKELDLDIVSHATSSFSAYESIIWAPDGEPNVFKSRASAVGEHALSGDGFYVTQGTHAAKNSGITIRFRLHPDAVNGVDFEKLGVNLLIVNKKAIRVIPESLKMDPKAYFSMLFSGEDIDYSDEGIHERACRRVETELGKVSKEDWNFILTEAENAVKMGRKIDFPLAALNVIAKSSNRFPEGRSLLNLSLESLLQHNPIRIGDLLHGREVFKNHVPTIEFVTSHSQELTRMGLGNDSSHFFVSSVFQIGDVETRRALVDQLVQHGDLSAKAALTSAWMNQGEYNRMPPTESQLKKIFEGKDAKTAYHNIGEIVKVRPEWKDHPELMEESILKGHSWPMDLIQQSQWAKDPQYAKIVETCNAKGYYGAPTCLKEELQRKRKGPRRFLICLGNIF